MSKLSHLYPWVSRPFIVSAPMRVMSGPKLAVQVSQAGGLGFIGPGLKTQDAIKDLETAAEMVKNLPPTSSSLASFAPSASESESESESVSETSPIGIGFQLWSDDVAVAVAGIKRFRPCAAWLFAPRGGQTELDSWARAIRDVSSETQIWIQIGTVAEAEAIARSPERPDVVVVQGAEAGGHGRAKDGLGLMALFPEIADVLADKGVAVFAAGGIADGRGVAAALCLGADGVVLGTRFLAASEARIARGYQGEILRARDGAVSTTRTLLYNRLRGTVGWPEEYSPRTIINRSFVEHQAGRPFRELKELHDEALKAGDSGWGAEGRLATYAGAGVGLIHEVKEAASIVHEVQQQAMERLRSISSTF